MYSHKLFKFAQLYNIASKPQGAGILFVCLEDDTVFLQKRSKSVDKPGYWANPGGTKEKGEDFWETAIREVTEEVGSVPKIKQLLDTKYNDGQFYYVMFICEVSKEEKEKWEPKLNKESEKAQWFPKGKLPSPLLPEFKKSLDI